MDKFNLKLTKITEQSNYWIWYGRLSPIIFLLIAFSVFEIAHTDIKLLYYTSWAIFISTSLIWWGWTLKVILTLVEGTTRVFELVQDLKNGIVEVKKDIHDLGNH